MKTFTYEVCNQFEEFNWAWFSFCHKGEDTLWNISFRHFKEQILIRISSHLIWFHEIHIKYVKRKPLQTMIGKNEYKRESSVQLLADRLDIF